MGAADVVPGVSGGTMAFILGIYEELINAIRSFDLKSLKLIVSAKILNFLGGEKGSHLILVEKINRCDPFLLLSSKHCRSAAISLP